jgi:undecaprenyl-diphosphatase
MVEVLQCIDENFFLLINHDLANKFFDIFFPIITNGTYWIIPIAVAAVWFLIHEKKKAMSILVMSILTVSLSDSLTVRVIKPLVARERPCASDNAIKGGRFLIDQKSSYSFPSAHAANAFGQAMLFSFFYMRWAWLFFSLATVIGFSRIYVGVHYPSDVLAGACLGVMVAWLVVVGSRWIQRKCKIYPRMHTNGHEWTRMKRRRRDKVTRRRSDTDKEIRMGGSDLQNKISNIER